MACQQQADVQLVVDEVIDIVEEHMEDVSLPLKILLGLSEAKVLQLRQLQGMSWDPVDKR